MSSNSAPVRLESRHLAGQIAPRAARVIHPDEAPAISPVAWREARSGAVPAKAGEVTPDHSAQLAQMQQQYERQVRDAHAAGMREGETAGRTRAAAEMQPVMERLTRTIEEIGQMRHRLRKEAEADTIKLALAISRRVLRRELAVDPDAMRGLVVAALEKLQSQEIARVRAHPAQAAQITSCLRNGLSHSDVQVVSDPSLQPGGIVFESNHGNLDASVDSQLQEIERGLTDHLRRRS